MSTEVTLFGLADAGVDHALPHNIPHVVTYQHVGISTARDQVRYWANDPEVPLWEYPCEEPGLEQFWVSDVSALLKVIEDYQLIKDDYDHDFEDVVDTLKQRPQLTWWFHFEF